MKVLVCGKGGSGKSTIVAMLGRYLADKGYRVLVVDADESNPGLYRMLGVENKRTLVDHLGGRKVVKEGKFSLPKKLEELPEDVVAVKGNLLVLSIGKIERAGEGCACPFAFLAREFVKGIDLKENEVLIVDTEAGVEHLGRGMSSVVDVVVNVVEPSLESIELSKKIKDMTGVRNVVVLNKAIPDLNMDVKPDVVIPYMPELVYDSLEGKEVRVVPQIEDLWEKIRRG